MKTKLVIVAMVVSLLVGGCATVAEVVDTAIDYVCANRVAIDKAISTAQATIDTIVATYGDAIPEEFQTVYAAAKVVIATGQAYLDTKVCPDAADVAAVDTKAAIMKSSLKIAKKIQAEKRQRMGK